jgi:general secretion pathway protein E
MKKRQTRVLNRGGEEKKSDTRATCGDDLLDMNQAVDLLRTSRPTVLRWLRTGKIQGVKAGRQWRFPRKEIDRFLKGQDPITELNADINPLLGTLNERLTQCGISAGQPSVDGDKVAQAVSAMMLLGVVLKASDYHIIPTLDQAGKEQTVEIRYRVRGALQLVATMDPRLLAPVIARWKRLANCDVRESQQPQDGRIVAKIREQDCDLRISFLPLRLGESLTVRLLSMSEVVPDLDQLGYLPPVKTKLERALTAHFGMVVLTGPMGCGKTTALYACLKRLASPDVKIITIEEDPVECLVPGVAQMQVRPSIGMTFASSLRASMRAAANVFLIGEIRDLETLELAQQCALTGHRVLTCLHTQDAVAALRRMVDIGSRPFFVGDTTRLVVAQRLIRKLCPTCSRPAELSAWRLERAEQIAREGGLDWDALTKNFRDPVGCPACGRTGYCGRTVIAEALEMTPELEDALVHNATAENLRTLAITQGMIPFTAEGIQRAASGESTVDEVLRFAAG